MQMHRFPSTVRQINEGLDELIQAIGKLGTLYESTRQMTPMFEDFAKLIGSTGPAPREARIQSTGRRTGPRSAGGRRRSRGGRRRW
ncbi:hypothetical protein LJK87_31545 [Paenibacillus sp. P25]|nr:hypothetical protein LJK87_31545 [Paenibacillus sp. P25]